MYQNRNRHKNQKLKAELWLAIFVNVAALWISYENLQYNRLQAYQSARVANQLGRLNQSTLMIDINNKIKETNNLERIPAPN